jgi:hypothetical protein
MKMKTPTLILSCITGVLLLFALTARAENASPAGTWTWSIPGRNGGPGRTNTLTLKIEDAKLTGKISAPGRGGQIAETPITNGKVADDTVSFAVVREFNGNSVTNNYTGKVSDDQIIGKTEFTRDGEVQSRDWKASRATESK